MPSVGIPAGSIFFREKGDGAALVLVMGTGADHTSWARQIAALAGTFRILAPDNRGSGRSTPAPGDDATCATFATDVIGVVDALGIGDFHVAGYSLGAAIAMEVALRCQQRVLGASFHAGWGWPNPATTTALERSLTAATESANAFLEAACRRNLSREFRESPAFESFLWNVTHGAHRATQRGIVAQTKAGLRHDIRGRIERLTCPVLVTAGEHDPVAPPEVAEDLAASIPGARLHVFRGPRAWHATPIEMWQEFNDVLLRFHGDATRLTC